MMVKNKKARKKKVKPDDYFAAGPFEFARFGKTTIARSRATQPQIDAAQANMAKRYPEIIQEIDALVGSIAKQIARLPPDLLLQWAWWEYAMSATEMGGEKDESARLASMRMVDYVQGVIASVKPETCAEKVSEDDWAKLKADVGTLFARLTLEYQMCATAHRKIHDPNLDMELEGFRVRSEMLWLNIRGKRYQQHERQALLDVLAPHSGILTKLFGLDASALADEFDKILTKLTHGLVDVALEMKELQTKALDHLKALIKEGDEKDPNKLCDKLFEGAELVDRI